MAIKHAAQMSVAIALATAATCPSAAFGAAASSMQVPINSSPVYEMRTDVPFKCQLAKTAAAYSSSIKSKVKIEGNDYLLYPTFDNQEEAMANFALENARALTLLSTTFNLEPISSVNWSDYYCAAQAMFDDKNCPDWYNETSSEYNRLLSFFDIYENDAENKKIESILTDFKASGSNFTEKKEEMLKTLDLLLPYQATLGNDVPALPSFRANNLGFNVSKGITYAAKYATRPNNLEYQYFNGGDCANFASQILEAGGVKQINKAPDKNSGWWHAYDSSNVFSPHTHSRSWTAAATFAKYMGIGYETKNNSKFSANIKKGDFIGFDKNNDGNCDHIGFITAVASTKTNGYYDYKVAQHTNNYNTWTSSDENSWETLQASGYTYYRIRR